MSREPPIMSIVIAAFNRKKQKLLTFYTALPLKGPYYGMMLSVCLSVRVLCTHKFRMEGVEIAKLVETYLFVHVTSGRIAA